eukprot:15448996-Alexandrium_andersonii.AAC.1
MPTAHVHVVGPLTSQRGPGAGSRDMDRTGPQAQIADVAALSAQTASGSRVRASKADKPTPNRGQHHRIARRAAAYQT